MATTREDREAIEAGVVEYEDTEPLRSEVEGCTPSTPCSLCRDSMDDDGWAEDAW